MFLSLLPVILAVSHVPRVSLDYNNPCSGYHDAVAAVGEAGQHAIQSLITSYNSSFEPIPHSVRTRIIKGVLSGFPALSTRLHCVATALTSAGVATGVEELALWSVLHEIGHVAPSSATVPLVHPHKDRPRGCLGLVSPAFPLHVRNMDTDNVNWTSAATVAFDVYVNGSAEPVFHTADWYWIGGGWETAVKPGVCAVQENWRFKDTNVTYESIAEALEQGIAPQLTWFGDWMSQGSFASYSQCEHALATTPVAAPVYFVVSGPQGGQGAVITRGTDVATDQVVHTIAQESSMGLVQSNYDWWRPDSTDDPRATHARNLLHSLKAPAASATAEAVQLFAVASTLEPKIRGTDFTAYTALLSAAGNGTLEVYTWP